MDRELTRVEVCYMCGATDRTIRNWQEKNGFPMPNESGRFSEAEVLAYCEKNAIRFVTVQR